MTERNRRRSSTGVVISNRMAKTIRVQTVNLVKHPRYGKYVRRLTKVLAHDAEGKANLGDVVEIVESRPLSKQTHWRLIRVVRSAPQ